MNTQIIAIANQKGGVGKTTTCANLGIGLAQAGKKVLLIDGDPQGSLTISLGNPQPDKLPFTLSDAMGKILMDQPIRSGEGILHHAEGVDLMPADIQLSGMEVSLVNAMSRETILRQYLDTLKGQYSHILIDCQPSLGMLTVNALAAANRIIIPVQAEYLPAKGLRQYKKYKLAAGVVCSKRLLNQAVGKSLRTHNLKPKKGAQVMRKNEKITALYERLSRDDFGKDDDQQRESNSISNQKAMLEDFAARQGFTNIPKLLFPMRNMMQFAAQLRKEHPMTLLPRSMPWAIPCISRMTPIRSPSCGRTPYSFCPPGWYIPSTGQSAKNSSSSCFGQTAAMLTIPSFFPLTRTRQIRTCGMYWPMD